MTTKTGMTKHSWVRAPREDWKDLGSKTQSQLQKAGWFDVPFRCAACGCIGHVMYKDGELPECPEEAANPFTKSMVDAYGDCPEQMVESVHAQ